MPQRDVNAAAMADLVGLVDQADDLGLDSQNGGDIYRHRELAGERLKSRVEGWLAHGSLGRLPLAGSSTRRAIEPGFSVLFGDAFGDRSTRRLNICSNISGLL